MTVTQSIVHANESIVWSWTTLALCISGWCVHWLTLYGRACKASRTVGTANPSLLAYWYADWPSTIAASIIVFAGYVLIPEIGATWPEFGKVLGIVADSGEVRGLNNLSAFLWGLSGASLADYAGKRLSAMVGE